MKADFWLKIGGKKKWNGWEMRGVPSTTMSKPSVKRDEVPIKVTIEIPDAYFQDPEITFKATLPPRDGHPVATVDLDKTIADVLSNQLGIKVHLTSTLDEPN